MTFPPSAPPPYSFQEEELFARDRARLVAEGIGEREIDAHLMAIQEAIGPNPFEAPWSQPILPENPEGTRVAISDATRSEPTALRVVFTVEDRLVRLWRIRRRDE